MKVLHAIAATLAAAAITPAIAQPMPGHDMHAMGSQQATTSGQGQVQKIDTEHGRITLKHAADRSMPAMTMVYRVADASVLAKVKVGDAVRFHTAGDNTTITELRALH